MAATKRKIGGEDTNITLEDQQQINTFARKSARFAELKDEIKAKKKELQNIEDASDELMLLDDDTAPIPTVFKYEDKNIVHAASGTDYEEFRSQFGEGERAYGYVRVETGDELSKRAKFAFITWIGESVPALQKAKVSTDKATVKQVIQNFAVEILTSDLEELTYDHVKAVLVKAGGANYGTGKSNH